jgi:ribosome-binding factor A
MSRRIDRVTEVIAHEAAQFIVRTAGSESLITVTRAVANQRGDRYTVFVSVLPDDKARQALSFLDRQRPDFIDYLKEHARLRPLPRIEFALDDGEKNRQRLDELSRDS